MFSRVLLFAAAISTWNFYISHQLYSLQLIRNLRLIVSQAKNNNMTSNNWNHKYLSLLGFLSNFKDVYYVVYIFYKSVTAPCWVVDDDEYITQCLEINVTLTSIEVIGLLIVSIGHHSFLDINRQEVRCLSVVCDIWLLLVSMVVYSLLWWMVSIYCNL